jgi:predicted RNA binding protein YcfA (HicA-like mRNA interferase family)
MRSGKESSAADLSLAIGVSNEEVRVKVREVVRVLREDGWYLARTRGSHHQYRHSEKKGLVTVPGTMSDDLSPGTLNSILKQAGLKV